MNVRIAHPEDAEALAQLNHEFNGEQSSPEQIRIRMLQCQQTETAIVAEADGQVMGFACLQVVCSLCYATPLAELTELYVQQSYRRRGLGRALVRGAEMLAKQKGAPEIVLRVGTQNLEGQAFYSSLGYKAQQNLSLHKRFDEQQANAT